MPTLSYAALSTAMIFSIPFTFAASSATALIFPPATNPTMDPPSFCAAVIAPRDPWFSLPSFCSRIASDDSSLAKAERDAIGVGPVRNCVRTWRKAENPVREIMVSDGCIKGKQTSSTFLS